MRLRSLRAFNEHVPGVAEWVATFLTVRRNLLATLCAVRERNCQPSPDAMFALVHDADLDRVRSPARTPIRCRVARQALLALGFPVPRDVAESTYPEYAACLRAEMVRNPDWHVAPPASRRFRVLAQAVRDIAFPVQVPYVRYVPRDVAGPFASAALERGAILAAIPLVRTLDARAFRDCLLQLSRTGPQAVRRLCELATREQLKAITYAFMQRVVPEAETQPWRHVLSLIPAAWHDPSVRRRLIDNADVYIAVRILPGITQDEQRRVFGALRTYNPADALEVLERNIGDVQRALRPADLTEFLTHWAPEVRLRAQMLVHTIDAPSVPANGVRAVPDGGSEG